MNFVSVAAYVATVSVFFPQWQKIEPHQLLNPPFKDARSEQYGFPKYPKLTELPKACAIYELDKVVGYRLTC